MESKKLFFYELEGRGYIFQNKKWDETKHGFEDDMLTMAWEMWSSAKHSVKAQAGPEGFVLVPYDVVDRCMSHIVLAQCHPNNTSGENNVMEMDLKLLEQSIEQVQEQSNESI